MDNVKLPLLNKVLIVGSLVNDPTKNESDANIPVVNFKIASKRRFKHKGDRKEETCFVNVSVWSKLAESCAEYLNKRDFVYIEGQLQSRNWNTRNGDSVSTVGILAKRVQFLTKREYDSMENYENNDEVIMPEKTEEDI